MNLGALVSGGKDSLYALYLAQKQGHEVKCLITIESANPESYMFHTPNVHLVEMQAEAMGMPLVSAITKGEKERELADLKKAISGAKEKFPLCGIVCGALASEYQKKRVQKICDELGLEMVAPLWHMEPEKELRGLVKEGFKVIIVKAAAQGLDEKWLGREIDEKAIAELVALGKKYGIHIGFEGGEAETLVLDAPMFRKRIVVESAERKWNGIVGELMINKAKLEEKRSKKPASNLPLADYHT